MKHYTLLFAFLSVFSFSHAQSFNYDTTTHFSIYEEAGGTYSMSVHFLPYDSSDVTFKWKTVENTLSSAWSMSLCDYPNCFFTIPDSATMWPLTNAQFAMGTRGFFTLLVDTDDSARVGSLAIYVYDSTDISIGDTIRWDVSTYEVADSTDTTTNVTPVVSEIVGVFPNPTDQYLSVTGGTIHDITLFDLLGSQIFRTEQIMTSKHRVDLADYPSGIYMLQINTSQGSYLEKVVKR